MNIKLCVKLHKRRWVLTKETGAIVRQHKMDAEWIHIYLQVVRFAAN